MGNVSDLFQKRLLRNFSKTDISTFLPQFGNVSDTFTETFQSFKIHLVEKFQTHFVLCGLKFLQADESYCTSYVLNIFGQLG